MRLKPALCVAFLVWTLCTLSLVLSLDSIGTELSRYHKENFPALFPLSPVQFDSPSPGTATGVADFKPTPTKITIATYNLWNVMFDWTQRKKAIARDISRADPDVVALQEVWAVTFPDSQSRNKWSHVEDLQQLLPRYKYSVFVASERVNLALPYPQQANVQEGIAILSKLPFKSKTHELEEVSPDDSHVRRVLHANFALPSGTLHVWATHISYSKMLQCRHTHALRRLIDTARKKVTKKKQIQHVPSPFPSSSSPLSWLDRLKSFVGLEPSRKTSQHVPAVKVDMGKQASKKEEVHVIVGDLNIYRDFPYPLHILLTSPSQTFANNPCVPAWRDAGSKMHHHGDDNDDDNAEGGGGDDKSPTNNEQDEEEKERERRVKEEKARTQRERKRRNELEKEEEKKTHDNDDDDEDDDDDDDGDGRDEFGFAKGRKGMGGGGMVDVWTAVHGGESEHGNNNPQPNKENNENDGLTFSNMPAPGFQSRPDRILVDLPDESHWKVVDAALYGAHDSKQDQYVVWSLMRHRLRVAMRRAGLDAMTTFQAPTVAGNPASKFHHGSPLHRRGENRAGAAAGEHGEKEEEVGWAPTVGWSAWHPVQDYTSLPNFLIDNVRKQFENADCGWDCGPHGVCRCGVCTILSAPGTTNNDDESDNDDEQHLHKLTVHVELPASGIIDTLKSMLKKRGEEPRGHVSRSRQVEEAEEEKIQFQHELAQIVSLLRSRKKPKLKIPPSVGEYWESRANLREVEGGEEERVYSRYSHCPSEALEFAHVVTTAMKEELRASDHLLLKATIEMT